MKMFVEYFLLFQTDLCSSITFRYIVLKKMPEIAERSYYVKCNTFVLHSVIQKAFSVILIETVFYYFDIIAVLNAFQ